METSQEQNFFNSNNQNSISKPEDPIIRLSSSSSSSSSSCSSIEAEPNPNLSNNNNNYAEQSPPTQTMERSIDNTTTPTTSSPNTPSYRIPSRVFARTTSTAPAEWSTLSNESLFSIHMGNNSFTGRDFVKSGELTFPQPPSPMTPTLPSPRDNKNLGGGVVEEAKTPMDIGKKAAETDKAYRASKEDEQKAAASIREVIMANEAAANKENNNNNKANMLDRSVSRRSEDLSVKSFAFQTPTPPKKQRKPSQSETPKISTEDEGLKKEEANTKPVTPKAEPDRTSNRNPNWLSCFPCCTTFCV